MSTSSGDPLEGEMIGPYRVGRRIGGGGMGVVFEADDAALDRRVALKVISPHLAGNPDFRARFTREAQALASLDSPHVVQVYAHGEDRGRLYLATQLVADGDLGHQLQDTGAPPLRVALDLVAQVAAGLADAHAAGLIHRDIKPANVLLRRRGDTTQAYLGDFGISRQIDVDHTRTRGGTIGTPAYMAPELHTGGTAGVASDVYSLGCLLWAALSGRAPYGGTSDYQVVSAHLEQPVPQLLGSGPVITEVNRILRRAMAKRPADRYPTAAALRDDLRRAWTLPDDGAVAAGGPRRRTASLAVGAALLVVAGFGAVALATSQGDDDEPAADPTSATPPPSSGGTTSTASGSDEATAIASLAEALQDQGVLTRSQARCTAEKWVEAAGLQAMTEAGFFDEDLSYVDRDRDEMTPEIEAAAQAAALACATA